MRILLVTPDYPPPPGGIQTLTRGIEVGLRRKGHTVEVVEAEPERLTLGFLKSPPTLMPWELDHPKECLNYPYFNHCYRRVRTRIDSFDPDVVHALHRINWPALLAANRADVPSVLTAHALELRDRRATAHATRLATRVHAVSEFTARTLSDATGLPQSSIAVIPPGIDIGAYRDESAQEDCTASASVVTIARLVPRKNVGTLLAAWERVDPNVRGDRTLAVVGDGPEREALARRFSGTNVTFTGWVSEEEKRSMLRNAEAFALVPGRDGFDVEGFGIVYLEAQAAGVPTIGSATGGVPEAVGSGGILVDDETDPDSVAAAIETVLNDDGTRRELLAGIEERIPRFDLESVAECHLQNYASLDAPLPHEALRRG